MDTYEKREGGFTLIELLIAIVVVGILAAVAIVGIAGLTNTGSKSACTQSADGAKSASAAYYANNSNKWPSTFKAMVDDTDGTGGTPINHPPVFEAPAGLTWNAAIVGPPAIAANNQMTVGSWKLTMSDTAGGTVAPTFTCS